MAGERPDWEWYQKASEEVEAGRLEAAEQIAADALDAGHLWRVSLLASPALGALHGRERFEAITAEARSRADSRHLTPQLLIAEPARGTRLSPLVLVLHGATGNAAIELERWRPATELGYIVAAAQSSQPATEDGFCWDPPRDRVWQDLRAIAAMLPPHARTVVAGFSQGAWVALNAALQADIVVAGTVVMVAPFAAPEPDLLPAWRRLRVKIIVGERDSYRARIELLAEQLSEKQHHVALEVIPKLAHAYPPDFTARLPALIRP